jgi:hypothetical protein
VADPAVDQVVHVGERRCHANATGSTRGARAQKREHPLAIDLFRAVKLNPEIGSEQRTPKRLSRPRRCARCGSVANRGEFVGRPDSQLLVTPDEEVYVELAARIGAGTPSVTHFPRVWLLVGKVTSDGKLASKRFPRT